MSKADERAFWSKLHAKSLARIAALKTTARVLTDQETFNLDLWIDTAQDCERELEQLDK